MLSRSTGSVLGVQDAMIVHECNCGTGCNGGVHNNTTGTLSLSMQRVANNFQSRKILVLPRPRAEGWFLHSAICIPEMECALFLIRKADPSRLISTIGPSLGNSPMDHPIFRCHAFSFPVVSRVLKKGHVSTKLKILPCTLPRSHGP